MLLLLTLAALGTPACWAGTLFGKGGGTYFSVSAGNENEISGIQFCVGATGLVKSVQVKIGPFWSEKYGVRGGECQDFLLWPAEYFTQVRGTYRVYIRSVELHTSQWRQAPFGKDSGHQFAAYPDERGQVLIGVSGQYGPLGLTGLIFDWGYPLVEMTTTPTTTTP